MSTRQRGWDIDKPFGEVAESYVTDDLMLAILNQRIEVKRDERFRETGNFYIETHQLGKHRRNGPWIPSGILTTEAAYWALVPGELGTVLFVPAGQLKLWATRPGIETAECWDSDCPTKGVKLKWSAIGAHLKPPADNRDWR